MGRANAAAEFRFFLTNFLVCLGETTLSRGSGVGSEVFPTGISWSGQLFGWSWVASVFFCIVPAWQYPIISLQAGVE